MDDARAALAGVAADMGSSKAQRFAQELHQECAPLDRRGNRLAVHGEAHRLLHQNLPCRASNPTSAHQHSRGASFLRRRRWVKARRTSQNALYTASYDAVVSLGAGLMT